MAKLEVIKTIEARKLNKRNRQVLAEPPVTIPYGALLDDIVENRDSVEFAYLGELYQCKAEMLRTSSHALESSLPSSLSSSAEPSLGTAKEVPGFQWEKIPQSGSLSRAKLPGGWLISVGEGSARSITFYPDPDHAWDGKTL